MIFNNSHILSQETKATTDHLSEEKNATFFMKKHTKACYIHHKVPFP